MRKLMFKSVFILLLLILFLTPFLFSQEGAPPAIPDNEAIENQSEETQDSYWYDPAGRRDPFLSLVDNPTGDLLECEKDTINCLLIDEIDIQGLWQIKGEWIAEVKWTDNRVYWLNPGDVLRDGEVVRIDSENVVFKQKINDPTRLKPFRQVIRSLEEKKQGRSQ